MCMSNFCLFVTLIMKKNKKKILNIITPHRTIVRDPLSLLSLSPEFERQDSCI